jgi:tRNA A-37 threonylcarbamoyl transferase component Bud32
MRQRYTTFQHGAARGVCIPELEPHLDFFSGAFGEWLAGQPTRIFLERPNRTAALRLPPTLRMADSASRDPEGAAVVVKQFGWRSVIHKLVRPLTGSKAIRSFRIAMILRDAGVATPRPLIAWDRDGGGTGPASYFITEEIPEALTLRQILKSPGAIETGRSTLLTELARLVRGMHDAGIWHRDLTIGNFLVAPKPVDGNRIFLIDLSRAVHLGRIPLPLRFMDMARMKLLDLWPEFFAAYCAGQPGWKTWQPVLNTMIGIRRRRMASWKKIKGQ